MRTVPVRPGPAVPCGLPAAARPIVRLCLVALVLLAFAVPAGATTDDDQFAAAVDALALGSYNDRVAAIEALAALGDPRAVAVLEALMARDLYTRKDTGAVVIGAPADSRRQVRPVDPVTGTIGEPVRTRSLAKIRVNNRVRRAIRSALGALTLADPEPARRLDAAQAVFTARDPDQLVPVRRALEHEADPDVRAALVQAAAAIELAAGSPAERLAAIAVLAESSDPAVQALLSERLLDRDGAPVEPDDEVRAAAADALDRIEQRIAMWRLVGDVYRGVSLGSVLLLAAIGLAITFGVMGVINMAHGEMVMLGAYTTFVLQDAIRTHAPGLFDWSLLIAVPLAFAVAGLVGIAIERGVIRFLYGRPLETLLATWGLSLILQQAVRTVFGPTNREVGTPDWMQGAFETAAGITLTYNRLVIIVFALAVFAVLLAVIRKSAFGLEMRAVTQNRRMASAMGIRTGWVDALTFGLGSGIAGIAGVALSQIDNVSPNLGQSYIVDSFMVVVFGGVGNLWGTLAGALSLGVANKLLEPTVGPVLGKILVLVAIILFIQKRPRGLFALKGRAVEA